MASSKESLPADFRKNRNSSDSTSNEDTLEHGSKTDYPNSAEDYTEYRCETSLETIDSDDEALSSEDRFITKLYSEVVDDIMQINKMEESEIDDAITEMKEKINQGRMTKFQQFDGIDFCKASNRCGYLRRYAACQTGLVREIIRRMYKCRNYCSGENLSSVILNKNQLKVVSLGGGPGNDLVGLCSALQETGYCVEKLDLTIVDISQGWASVFPSIMKKANDDHFGCFSKILKRVEITTSFVEADLRSDGIFENENLSSALGAANIVLMVKLVQHMSDQEGKDLIYNVFKTMQVDAQLIIDTPFDKNFYKEISCVFPLYHQLLKYKMSFNPINLYGPSIISSHACIGVYLKTANFTYEDSSPERPASDEDSPVENEQSSDTDEDRSSGIDRDSSSDNKDSSPERGEHSSSDR